MVAKEISFSCLRVILSMAPALSPACRVRTETEEKAALQRFKTLTMSCAVAVAGTPPRYQRRHP